MCRNVSTLVCNANSNDTLCCCSQLTATETKRISRHSFGNCTCNNIYFLKTTWLHVVVYNHWTELVDWTTRLTPKLNYSYQCSCWLVHVRQDHQHSYKISLSVVIIHVIIYYLASHTYTVLYLRNTKSTSNEAVACKVHSYVYCTT